MRNLQAIVDLAYDASTYCAIGDSREQVNARFRERGYKERTASSSSDLVEPRLVLGGWSFRTFMLEITYGADGKVHRCQLISLVGAL